MMSKILYFLLRLISRMLYFLCFIRLIFLYSFCFSFTFLIKPRHEWLSWALISKQPPKISLTKFDICLVGLVSNNEMSRRNFRNHNNGILFSVPSFFDLLRVFSVHSLKFITNLFWCCEPYISSGSFIKWSLVINQPISLRVCTKELRNSLVIYLMPLSVVQTILRQMVAWLAGN
jgi:hypothetical protein